MDLKKLPDTFCRKKAKRIFFLSFFPSSLLLDFWTWTGREHNKRFVWAVIALYSARSFRVALLSGPSLLCWLFYRFTLAELWARRLLVKCVLCKVISCRVALELHAELESLNCGGSMKNRDNFSACDFFFSSCDWTQCHSNDPDCDLYFCNERPPPGDALTEFRPTPISGMFTWQSHAYLQG